MPDIPALIHCHICAYWFGPSTAEDSQVIYCGNCHSGIRVYRYRELHPRSRIGVNVKLVKVIGRNHYGNWLFEFEDKTGEIARRYIHTLTVNRRTNIYRGSTSYLKEIYDVRRGGVMHPMERAS